MQELLVQILGYVWGIWRYRWQALVVTAVVSFAGWGWVFQMPEAYQASARVHVDTNTVLRPLLRGLAIQPNIDQRIQLMSRTLLSRPNLEKLMRMTDLDLQAETDAQKDEIIKNLKKHIGLSGDRSNTSLYSLSFEHEDREMAKRVVQSLITVFIESTLGDERADSLDAQKFLDQQIDEYEGRLTEAEARLAKFKQKYVGVLPGQSGGYYVNLAAARKELSTAELRLNEMTQRRNELKRQLAGEDPVFVSGGSDSFSQSPLDSRINSLQSRLDDLLTRYTDRFPEVVQIRGLIEVLEQERQAEIESALAGEPTDYSGLQESPVYQQMRTMLAEAEARVAEMSVRVKEYRGRVKEMEDLVDNIPVIEAELKQLNRDYEVVRQKHSELLTRRESALISQDVEQKSNDLVFRVIDPPFVPLEPSEPNKLLLNAVVLLFAIAVGGGVAFLWSLLNPVVIDRFALSRVTDLPVLGTVSLVSDKQERRAALMSRLLFFGLFMCLIAAYAAINVLHIFL